MSQLTCHYINCDITRNRHAKRRQQCADMLSLKEAQVLLSLPDESEGSRGNLDRYTTCICVSVNSSSQPKLGNWTKHIDHEPKSRSVDTVV